MGVSKKAGQTLLAGDVGGTKTFLGLFRQLRDGLEPLRLASYENGRFGGIGEVVGDFLEEGPPASIDAASFGVACPVVENRGTLTNLRWVVDGAELADRFGIKKLELINDLVATAWGVGVLGEDDLATLQAGKVRSANCALIAAGTGLGEAVIYRAGTNSFPTGSEGGHADYAPRNAEEIELLEYLSGLFGHVSYERVLSGPGLVNIYNFLKGKRGGAEPAYLTERIKREGAAPAVSEEATDGKDKNCRDALEMFISIYGAEAGNLALRSMAVGGVYVGGGIAPKVLPALKRGSFIESFRQKGRFEGLLSEIPVKVILNEKTALFGAAVFASRLTGEGLEKSVKKIVPSAGPA
ncbi:MAG: glucokinase [Deltaproteobacteria bacterium]|nr:glucokinase [Deltaproteobacteria bacterium]